MPEADAERGVEVAASSVAAERQLPVVETIQESEDVPPEQFHVQAPGSMDAAARSGDQRGLVVTAGAQPKVTWNDLALQTEPRRNHRSIHGGLPAETHRPASLNER